jgi:chromosome segregation ATPase
MKSKLSSIDIEFDKSIEKLRCERYEHERQLASLDDALTSSNRQCQVLQETQRSIDEKHEKHEKQLQEHIDELQMKIDELIRDRTAETRRYNELLDEKSRLEHMLNKRDVEYDEKLRDYQEKHRQLTTYIEDMEKKWLDAKQQLDMIIVEKDETLADMLIAVRVASEMRHGRLT